MELAENISFSLPEAEASATPAAAQQQLQKQTTLVPPSTSWPLPTRKRRRRCSSSSSSNIGSSSTRRSSSCSRSNLQRRLGRRLGCARQFHHRGAQASRSVGFARQSGHLPGRSRLRPPRRSPALFSQSLAARSASMSFCGFGQSSKSCRRWGSAGRSEALLPRPCQRARRPGGGRPIGQALASGPTEAARTSSGSRSSTGRSRLAQQQCRTSWRRIQSSDRGRIKQPPSAVAAATYFIVRSLADGKNRACSLLLLAIQVSCTTSDCYR